MILAVDTDVLVNWAMAGASHHRAARSLIETEVASRGGQIGLTSQVLFEFLHVTTDPRRFQRPLSLDQAGRLARQLWDGRDVARILPGPTLVHRTLELLAAFRLGRKRILDTALAATLEAAGITRLATFNRRDFEIFPFLQVIEPV
ncbi:MAG: PIN domain-containing protein [Deinococcus sp.]|nr:PIN domain-containing protein [Deinococcus sp.]